MAVRIRLARHGRKKNPFYRIVVADGEMRRDGRYLEKIGHINPLSDPPTVHLDEERAKHWIGLGAKPSDSIANVIEKRIPGYLEDIEKKRREKIRSQRAKRKTRIAARAS